MAKPKLWTRDFILVSFINFVLIVVFYLLVVVIGSYAIEQLHASVSQSGLVVGMFIIGVLTGRLAVGQFIDRLGRKRSMLAGLVLATTAVLFYYVEAGIGFLIATRFLHGVAIGVAATAAATMVTDLIPLSRRGEGIGYFSMSSSLATAIGPFIGIYMMHHAEFVAILTLCFLLSGSSIVVALMLRVPEAQANDPGIKPLGFSLSRLLDRKVIPICCVVLLSGLCFSSLFSYLNAYASERGLNEAASFYFLAYAITLLASRPFSGRLMDKRGANIIMYPGFVCFAMGLVLLGVATTPAQLLLSACLVGLGFGNMQSCGQAIVSKIAEPARMGLATSTFFIFVDAGLGFGPYFLGLIIGFIGYSHLYILLGGVSLFSMLIYYFVHGRHDGELMRIQRA